MDEKVPAPNRRAGDGVAGTTGRANTMRPPAPALLAACAVAGAAVVGSISARAGLPRWAWCSLAAAATAVAANEASGKPVLLLRWSALRMLVGMNHVFEHWQVGDGREEALAEYVLRHAEPGNVDAAIRVVDEFCYRKSFLINVGDEKGEILDRAVRRVQPARLLELGTYCGYSALRMARSMPPHAHLWSVEFNAANAAIARRIWRHAGIEDRVTAVVGTLGDGGRTLRTLRDQHGFSSDGVDLVFIDHVKEQYVADLERILGEGWLHPGSVVVADNVKFPGAPEYLAYMRKRDGTDWRTTEHQAHAEYQSIIPDLVLESEYLHDSVGNGKQASTTAGTDTAGTSVGTEPGRRSRS